MSLQILRNRGRSNAMGNIKPEPIPNVNGGPIPVHHRNYPIRQADYGHNGQFVGPNTVISMSFADQRLTTVEDIIREENEMVQSGYPRLKRIEDRTMLENSPFRQLMGDFRFTKDGGREFLPRRDILELLKHDDVTVVRELSNRFKILPRDALRAVRQYRITGEFKNIVMVYDMGIGNKSMIKDEYDVFNSRFGYNVNILDKQTHYIPDIESFLMNNVVIDPNIFKHNNYSRSLEKTEFNKMFVESRVLAEPFWGPILIRRYPLATEKIVDWETGDEVMVNINPMSFCSYVSDFNDVLNIENTYNRRFIYNPWRRYGKFALDGINSDLATGGQFLRYYGDFGTADSPNKNKPYGITRFIKRLNLDLDEADIKLLRKWGINPKQLTNDINLDGEFMDPNRRAAEINGRQYLNATNTMPEPNIHFNQSVMVPESPESITDIQNQYLPQLTLEEEENISYANNSDETSSDEDVNDNTSYGMGNRIVFDEETERELEEEFKRITDSYYESKAEQEAKKLNQSSTNKKKEDNNNNVPENIEQVSTKVEICNDDTIYNSDSNTIVKTIKVDSSMIKLKDVYDKCYNPKTKIFNSVLYNEVVAKIRLQKDYEFNQSFKVPSDCRSIHPTYKGIPNEYVMSTTFIDTGEEFLKYLLNNKLDLNKPTNVTALPNTAKYYCSIRFTNKFDSYTSRNIYCKDNDNIVHNVVDIDLGKSSSTDNWVERRYNNYVYKHNPKKIVQLFTHHIGLEVSGGEYSCKFKNNLTTDKDGNPLINYYTGKFDGIYIVTINNYTTDCVKTSNAVDISNSVIRDNVANKEAINYSGEGAHSSSLGLLYSTNHVDKLNDENKYYLNHNGTKRIIKIDFIPYSLLTQLDMVYNSPDHYYYSDKLSMLFTTNGFEPSAHNLDYLSKYDTEGYIKHRIKFSNLFFYNDVKIKTDINPLLENDLERYFNSLGNSIQPIKDTTLHKILPINGSNIDVDVKAYVSPNSKYNKELLYYGIRDGCIKIPIRSNDIISSNLYKDNKETDIIRITYNRYGEVSSYIDMQIDEALTKLLIFTKPEAAIDRSTLDDYIIKYQPDLFKNVALENLKHEHTAKIEEIKHEHSAKLAELKQEHAKEIKEIENKHSKEMQAKEDIFKEKELALKTQVEEASGKRADKKLGLENEKLLNEKSKLEIERDKLKAENNKISNDYNLALRKIKDDEIQFDKKMKDTMEQFNKDLELKDKTLNAKIETEKAQLSIENAKLITQYNLKIEELNRKDAEWQAKLAQQSKEHEQKEREFKLNFNKSRTEFRKKLKQQNKEFKATHKQRDNEIKQKYISQNKDIMAKLVMQDNEQKHELDVLRKKYKAEAEQAAKERSFKMFHQSRADKAEAELAKLKSQLNITETNNKLDKEYKATVKLKNIEQTFEAQENAKDRKAKKQELAAKQYHESIEAAKDRRASKEEAIADRKHKTIEAAKDRKAKAIEAANDRKFKAAEAKKERKEKREERAHKEKEAAMDRAQKAYENNVDRRMKVFEMDYNAKLKDKEADRKFEDSLMSGVSKAGVTILGAMSKRWFK